MFNLRKIMSAIMCVVIMSTMFVPKSPIYAETITVTPGSTVMLQFNSTISSKAARTGSQLLMLFLLKRLMGLRYRCMDQYLYREKVMQL